MNKKQHSVPDGEMNPNQDARSTLDALSAHICVLDEKGVILSTNLAWNRFAQENPPAPENNWVGVNYLDVCDRANGANSLEASEVASGIRAVIRGELSAFQLEYPCHSPNIKRWFIVRVTRFNDGASPRIAIAHEEITDRKLTEQELALSEEKFSRIFENSPIVMSLIDLSTRTILDVNQAYCRKIGYSRNEIINIPGKLGFASSPERVPALIDMLSQQDRLENAEFSLTTRAGEKRIGLLFAEPVEIKFRHLHILMFIDATEAKQAELALKQSEEKFRLLTEKSVAGIYIVQNEKIVYVNPVLSKIFGYSALEIIGRLSIQDLIHPDDMQIVMQKLRARLDGVVERSGAFYRALKKDGSLIYIEVYGTRIDYDGRPAVMGTIIDVTSQVLTNEKLRESENKYRLIAENADDWIYWIAPDGTFRFVSPSSERVTGYTPQEFMENPRLLIEIIHPEDRQIVENHLSYTGSQQDHALLDFRLIHKSGKVCWISHSCSPIFDETGEYIGRSGTNRDITERKQIESIIKNRNDILLAVQNFMLEVGSELRLPALLSNILKQAQSILAADRGGGIYFYDAGENVLRLAHGSGINQGRNGVAVKIGEGVAGHVYHTRQPIIVDNYSTWKEHATVIIPDPPSTVLGVPLFLNNIVIGVLTLIADSSLRTYTDLDVQTAEMFAAQASVAIQNARLYQQARQEIVDRKEVQEKLSESENLYHSVVSALSEGVVVQDQYDKVVTANQAAANILGLTMDQLMGKDSYDPRWQALREDGTPFRPEEHPSVITMKTGQPVDQAIMNVQVDDDKRRIISVNTRPIFDEHGNIFRVVASFSDITERRRSEESLRELEKRFSTIFYSSPMPISLTRLDDNCLVDVNQAWLDLIGFEKQEVIGQSLTDLNIVFHTKPYQELLTLLQERGGVERRELQMKKKSGEVIDFLLSAEVINLDRQAYILSMGLDITDRKRREMELQKHAAQMTLINQIGQQIASVLDIQTVLDLTARLVYARFGYYHIGLFTLDAVRGDLVMRSRAGQFEKIFPDDYRIKLGDGMVGFTAQTGKMLLSNRVNSDAIYKNYFPQLINTTSELSLPILVSGQVVGVLDVQSPESDAFHEEDVKVLQTVAAQVAVALENARLYQLAQAELAERKLAEERLKSSEDLYRRAITAAGAVPYYRDYQKETQTYTFMGEGILQLTGYSASEITPAIFDQLEQEYIMRGSLAHLTTEEAGRLSEVGQISHWACDYRIKTRTGETRWVADSALQVRDENNRRLGVIGILQDITERKEFEFALQAARSALEELNRELEKRVQDRTAEVLRREVIYRALFENSNDGIFLMDTNAKDIDLNQHALNMLGYTREEYFALEENAIIQPEQQDDSVHRFEAVLRGEYVPLYERTLIAKGGKKVETEINLSPVRDLSGKIIMVQSVVRDITERKKAQEELRQSRDQLRLANSELEKASRLKDEFLASMSHELRTPLTGILGLSEVLQLQTFGPLTEKQLKAVRNIEISGRHLLELINDILDLSKIEAGKLDMQFEPCSAADVCQASLNLVKGMATQKKISVSFSIQPDSIIIRADVRRLKQILVNLLSNAIKFTPENGKVGLDVNADPLGGKALFTVWDTGIGIQPENLKKLFSPFVQLDSSLARQYSGTGLGLSLVKRMTEMHEGTVSVESVPGQGSRFTVALPWSTYVTQPIESNIKTGPLQNAMLIDDNEMDVEHLSRYLRDLGVKSVIVQRTCKGAFEKAALLHPHTILLDLNLPDGYGLDLLSRLKMDGRTRDIPVMIVSVEERRSEAFALGATGYLVKPINRSELQSEMLKAASFVNTGKDFYGNGLPGVSLSIMIAEDNKLNLEMLSDFLDANGYRVIPTRSGFELLERVPEVRPNIILMDIQMPGMDGLETIRRLRAHADPVLASTPIIAITALAMVGDREKCLAAGANDYMSKPVDLDELLARIDKFLKGQSQ